MPDYLYISATRLPSHLCLGSRLCVPRLLEVCPFEHFVMFKNCIVMKNKKNWLLISLSSLMNYNLLKKEETRPSLHNYCSIYFFYILYIIINTKFGNCQAFFINFLTGKHLQYTKITDIF